MSLTDAQWAIVTPLLPQPTKRADGRGRPRQDDRKILDGILWMLRTGAQWDELPKKSPPKSTCHDRFQAWNRSGVLARLLKALADDQRERGEIDLSECFVDATFVSAKKGALPSARPNEAKALKSWQWQTLEVFLSPYTWRALPRMRSRWLKRRLRIGSLTRRRNALLATALTTAIRSMSSSEPEAPR